MSTTGENEIWVLEDDPLVQLSFERAFGLHRKTVRFFKSYSEFLSLELRAPVHPELLLIDLRLEDACLFDELRGPRKATLEHWIRSVPTIVISGRDEPEVIRAFLKAGASDYLVKPLSLNELWIKAGRALRSHVLKEVEVQSTDGFTPREKKILQALLETESEEASGLKGATKADLIERVWGSLRVSPGALDVHFSHLRAKLAGTGWELRLVAQGRWGLARRGV